MGIISVTIPPVAANPNGGGGGGGGASKFMQLTDVTPAADNSGKFLSEVAAVNGERRFEFVPVTTANVAGLSSALGNVSGTLSALSDEIAAESLARAAGDANAVQIAKDYADAGDFINAQAISDESAARAAADNTLQTAIDGKAATNHMHAIADVTNLQTALDGKAATSHMHAIADVTNLQSTLDAKEVTANKAPSLASPDNTKYPTTQAVATGLAAKQNTITLGSVAQYLRGDLSLSNFASDVLSTALSGLVFTTNAAITATDTVLQAFGKLQAQVDKRLRFDAAQTLTAAEQTHGKANLGITSDLLLTAKQITGTATASNVPSLVLTPDATVFTEAATHVVLASKFDTANNRGGSLSLQRPDNAATGGNQRGIGSIDMQVSRTAATQVTGDYSIALGQNQAVTGCSIGISRSYGQTVNDAGIVLNNFKGTFAAGAVTQGIALNCGGAVTNGISLGNSSNLLNGIGIQIPALDPGYANVSKGIGIGSYVTATNYAFAIGLIATATDGSFCMSADSSTSIQAMNGSFAMGSGGLTNGKYALSMGRINLNSGYCNGVFGEGITTGNYHNGVYTGGNGAVTKINALSAQIAANSTAVLKFGNGSVQTGYLQEMQNGYEAFIGYVYLEARVGTDSPTAAAYYKIEAAKHNVGAGGLLGTPVITTLGTTDNTVTSLWTLTVTFVSGILRITVGLNNAAGSAKMQVQALG